MVAGGGVVLASDADGLATAIDHWLQDANALQQARAAAKRYVTEQQGHLDSIVGDLCEVLRLGGDA